MSYESNAMNELDSVVTNYESNETKFEFKGPEEDHVYRINDYWNDYNLNDFKNKFWIIFKGIVCALEFNFFKLIVCHYSYVKYFCHFLKCVVVWNLMKCLTSTYWYKYMFVVYTNCMEFWHLRYYFNITYLIYC